MNPGYAFGTPRLMLRLEGLGLLGLAALLYHSSGAAWWLFAALFLVPDLSFLAYLAGRRAGAVAYNLAHFELFPALLAGAGVIWEPRLVLIALIWAAHIGWDRMLGYGLKYATSFDHTHLGLIGKAARAARAAG